MYVNEHVYVSAGACDSVCSACSACVCAKKVSACVSGYFYGEVCVCVCVRVSVFVCVCVRSLCLILTPVRVRVVTYVEEPVLIQNSRVTASRIPIFFV